MIAAGLVLTVAALGSLTLLPRFFESGAAKAFNETAHERGVADAEHMAHIFYYSIWAPVQEVRPGLTFLETGHPTMMDVFSTRSTFGLDVSVVNVWSVYGEPVWLGDPNADTPSPSTEEWFERLVGAGMPYSINDAVGSRNEVRTFVPLRDAAPDSGKVGNVIGVLELDRDVTIALGIASTDGRDLGQRVGFVATAVALLFGTLGWIVWRAQLSSLKTRLRGERGLVPQTESQAAQSTKLAAMGELVASVAHELNNPLTTIWGVSQLLGSRDLGDSEASEVGLITREAERMSRIVHNLLSFARAGNSDKTETSINAAINSALELRGYHFMVNNIHVDAQLDDSLPNTEADPHKIQQVVLNLITNAEQAILKVSTGGNIAIETKRIGSDIVLTVSDDGPGMSKETAGRVFDPFYTTKAAGDGTGLGLAISDTIIREHEGSIAVESELGLGTTFTIHLPIIGEAWQSSGAVSSGRSDGIPRQRTAVHPPGTQNATQPDDDPVQDLTGGLR